MASRRAIGHWLILLLLSVLFSSLLLRIHLPAALLLGPLIAGLILSLRGVKLSIPRPCYLAAQAIVGCMIARAINPSVFGVLFNNWALVLAILLTTLAISGLTGWLLVRYSALPGATGAWGSSPGGASAMDATEIAKMVMPRMITVRVKKRASVVCGTMSPKPTVDITTMAK